MIYRPSDVIIELVGPEAPPPAAMLWGLTLVTSDVDHTHRFLPTHTKAPWPAVQPGRTMTVLKEFPGISIPIAFMSPHVKDTSNLRGESREQLYQQRARAQERELKQRNISKM